MKLTVALLLLVATSQAAEETSRKRTKDDTKTEKRALVEGNAGVQKRAPVIATALPPVSPGIEYADTKEYQSEKSPLQQVYATPVPQLAKISDVLTGQGPPFQAAIASHLFSPISIYQPRLATPTYEVSAPVPSQLAYTEKITYQPQPVEQFTPQVYKHVQKQASLPRLTYQPVQQYQQLQPQPQHFSQYQPQQLQQVQPQVFQVPYQPQLVYNPQPLQYQPPIQYSQQPIAYLQRQQPQQAGIVYAQQVTDVQRPIQRELKTAEVQNTPQVQEKPEQQNQNSANNGAISFASFSVGPPVPQQLQQFVPQPEKQSQYQQQNQLQYRPQAQLQPQQYQTQPTQPQIQAQHQYQIQRIPFQPNPQIQNYNQQQQIQIQPQIVQKLEPVPANSVSLPSKPSPNYIRQPVQYQPQIYQNQGLVYQNPYENQQLPLPTFPPVQFFGKYAQTLFKNYQQ